jgi:hypothetical protein
MFPEYERHSYDDVVWFREDIFNDYCNLSQKLAEQINDIMLSIFKCHYDLCFLQ